MTHEFDYNFVCKNCGMTKKQVLQQNCPTCNKPLPTDPRFQHICPTEKDLRDLHAIISRIPAEKLQGLKELIASAKDGCAVEIHSAEEVHYPYWSNETIDQGPQPDAIVEAPK